MTNLIERGIDIARRQVEADNRHEVDASFSFFGPGFQTFLNGKLDPTDEQTAKAGAAALYAAIPDISGNMEWLDGTDDFLVHQWSFKGTFSEPFGRIPPTGKHTEMHGCTIMQHDGEHFSCFWRALDNAEFGRWLGGAERTPSTASAERPGGNMPFGPGRDEAERTGLGLAERLHEAESLGDFEATLKLFCDPIVEGTWGNERRHSREALRGDAVSWLAPGSKREIHQRLCIGDRVVERFTYAWEGPDGQTTTDGCTVMEHDGSRFSRFWSYFEDYEAIVPGVYAGADSSEP